MTEAVIVSSNNTVIYAIDTPRVIVSGIMGPPGRSGTTKLAKLEDVSTAQLESGSTLVYNSTTKQWEATRLLNGQNIDCGEF